MKIAIFYFIYLSFMLGTDFFINQSFGKIIKDDVELNEPFLGGFNKPKIQWLDWNNDGLEDLFLLDGKPSNLVENDVQRRNTIATLLADWGLVTILNPEAAKDIAPLRQVKVISYKDKHMWELCPKYNIGKKS